MHKKFFLGAALAAFGAVALIPGTASAAVTDQVFESQAVPIKQAKKKRGGIRIRTDVDTAYNAPPFTNFTPPAVRTVLNFDKDWRFDAGRIARCSTASIAGKNVADAKAACGKSFVGQGNSTVRTQAGGFLFGEVTAFNGARSGGNAVLLLHVDLGPAVPTKPILTGVLGPSTIGGFGQQLDVTVPVTPGTVITHFDTTINKRVSKVKKKVITNKKTGKKKTIKIKTFFASARCGDGRWVHQETTTFNDGSAKTDQSTPQRCKKK